MPSDWKTFQPTKARRGARFITVRPDELYMSDGLIKELKCPGYIKVQINRTARAVAVSPADGADPAALNVTSRNRIRNKELPTEILAVFGTQRVQMIGRAHSNGKAWIFQEKPEKETDAEE